MKKIVSVLLSVLLILSCVNISVFAEEENERSVYTYSCIDASTIENGMAVQRFKISGGFMMGILDEIPELGMVYSDTNEVPQIGDSGVTDVVYIYNTEYISQIFAVSEALTDETTYYARAYTKYADGQIVYSDVISYTTAITVPAGGQIGCELVISGGIYNIDNARYNSAAFHWAEINEGYSALYNGYSYSSYNQMFRKGINSLITIDNATNKRYLHLFTLNFAKPPVQVNDFEVSDISDGSVRFKAQYSFIADDYHDKNHIQEAGIIYGEDKYALEVGNSNIEIIAIENVITDFGSTLEDCYFAIDSPSLNESATYYIRGFVKSDGKYYYSSAITPFSNGTVGTKIQINSVNDGNSFVSDYTTTVYDNCSKKLGNTTYYPGQTITLDTTGKYYIINTWSNGSNSIDFVVINKDTPVISGIVNNGLYNSSVTPLCDENNLSFYLSKDGGTEKEFANGISIQENGYYMLKVVGGGVWECFFEIKSPVVTTQDCWFTTTTTAELSASFENNGAVLERGFVFSSINNTPVISGLGCTTFVPAEDLYPTFLTATVQNLAINTKYFFRAFVKTGNENNPIIAYGEIKEFTTAQLTVPNVMLWYPSDITNNSITIHSNVFMDGGSDLTERGIVYSTSPNPVIGESGCAQIICPTVGTGEYAVTMTGLLSETSYYIKAYAINEIGTGYSWESIFSTEPAYTVTFNLDGGTRLGGGALVQTGDYGFSAIAPVVMKSGFNFAGWDSSFDNVTQSIIVTALWTDNKVCRVNFDLDGGTHTGGGQLSQDIPTGFSAQAPTVSREGYTFLGWSKSLDNITAYTEIRAVWERITYQVTFNLDGGARIDGGELTQIVNYGESAVAPNVTKGEAYEFLGFDKSLDNITENTTITALWQIKTFTVKFYDQHGAVRIGGGELYQTVEYGGNAIPPIMAREGYTFIEWDKSYENITAYTAIRSHFARIKVVNTETWATNFQFTVEYDNEQGTTNQTIQTTYGNIGWSTYNIYDHEVLSFSPFSLTPEDLNVKSSEQTIYARIALGGRWENGEFVDYVWKDIESVTLHNIDNIFPLRPTFTYEKASDTNSNLLINIIGGADSDSGLKCYEIKIGTGEWHEIPVNQSVIIYNNLRFAVRSVDNAGNKSGQYAFTPKIDEIKMIDDYNHVVEHYVYTEYKPLSEDHIITNTTLMSSKFNEYVYYPTGDGYRGCGVKAAQIFAEWFGISMPQGDISYTGQYGKSPGNINYYVETTDFGLYLDWLIGDTWADPSIFTTPAQLDTGVQDILNLRYSGYNVERSSPNSSRAAIDRIESYLSNGYPVIILSNDGGHWQVISGSKIVRDANGDIVSSSFTVHDGSGDHERTWSQLDYFFEDNLSAELARLADYTSYYDTIMSVSHINPVILPSTKQKTKEDVTVEITYPLSATSKQYKLGTGNWVEYTGPVSIKSNVTAYARYIEDGVLGPEVSLQISNIDKTAPSITGVTNGNSYNIATITFNEGTATLNGASCSNGAVIRTSGAYHLVVTDAVGNSSIVDFTINNTSFHYENGKLTGVNLGTKLSDLKNNLNTLTGETTKIFNKNNIEITDNNAKMATGMYMQIFIGNTVMSTKELIIYGDVSGDGDITIADLAKIKQHLLKSNPLEGAFKTAGDLSGKGSISISDLMAIKKQLLGLHSINQNGSDLVNSSTQIEFLGSSLGDPSNVVFSPDGGNHDLNVTYKNNMNEIQSTVFIVNVTKNGQVISTYSINKVFAALEEYTFDHTIYIPATDDGSTAQVDFILVESLLTMKTKHDTVKNSINNVR